jgi:PfaD family protein
MDQKAGYDLSSPMPIIGWWQKGDSEPKMDEASLREAVHRVIEPVILVQANGRPGVAAGGEIRIGDLQGGKSAGYPLSAYVPPVHPRQLGDQAFKRKYGLVYPYVAGEMARGITSVRMVEEMGRAGMIGFFGSAGLSTADVEDAITALQQRLGALPFGFNLIHSPNDPDLEAAVVRLFIARRIRLISASAFLDVTLPLVLFRLHGIHRNEEGRIVCPNRIIAKVSRVEVARKFLSPPPEKLLAQLVEKRAITADQAALASGIPLADDLTAEADSGGHTDNRPAISLLPTMMALRDEMVRKHRFTEPICVGLAGGIATPDSAAAAFAMGAAYILTGSVNQSCVEAGICREVRCMLADAGQADVTMAPSADMFEMGVKVQVLKRGTLFPFRAAKLYEIYCKYDGIESIPKSQAEMLKRDYFRGGLEDAWEQTRLFFLERDPRQIALAEQDPKHKMALLFRSYLGRTSRWAITGEPERKIDYQIWCGPSIGAFNAWVKGTFLENPENRRTVTVAMNILYGAAVATRASWLRCQRIPVPPEAGRFSPMELHRIFESLGETKW